MGASSRLRLMQYLPKFKNQNIEFTVIPFFDDNHLTNQYEKGKTRLASVPKYIFRRINALMSVSKPDLIWLEYEAFPWMPWFFERIFFSSDIPVVSDYDDAIFHRYDNHRYKFIRLLLGNKIQNIMKFSKIVVAGNKYLADYAHASKSKNIKIIPTVVDLNIYTSKVLKKRNDKVRIGWIGTPLTYEIYFKKKLDLLLKISTSQKCEIAVMGAKKSEAILYPWIKFYDWTEENEVNFIKSLDIGIMPLNDSPWERGKCGYKIIQYMSCSIPVVVTPIGVNQEIVNNNINGFHANSDNEWQNALEKLIKDKNLRVKFGSEGRKKIERSYSLQNWSVNVEKILIDTIINNSNQKNQKTKEADTIKSFGDEWKKFNQTKLIGTEYSYLFNKYFHIFPWDDLPNNSQGFDMGCGSGRWASLVAKRIGKLNCIDPSLEAINVAKKNLSHLSNVSFFNQSLFDKPLPYNSQDFGYSLGVLHHIENTQKALSECVKFLKDGAPFLVYIYYDFENRPKWYRLLWKLSDLLRMLISKLNPKSKLLITNFIALIVYLPMARLSLFMEKLGLNVDTWILSSYRKTSFYTMKTDSRDRFGTPLEKRFSKSEIELMMKSAGLNNIKFSNDFPFWCALGRKNC